MTEAVATPSAGINWRIGWLSQKLQDIPGENEWLSEFERKRFADLRSSKRQNDWRLGRWTAKRLVATQLGVPFSHRQLSEIEIRPEADGAPEVFVQGSRAPVSLSISHAGDVSLCAVAELPLSVGCDIESIRPREPLFVQDYFAPEEIALLRQTSEGKHDEFITLIWSAKESALKVLREGLRRDTRSVVVFFAFPPRRQGWNPLTVRCVESARIFPGWWSIRGDQVLCLTADRASLEPRELLCSSSSFENL